MNTQRYKIMQLKELAIMYGLKPAKEFESSSKYLEYVITEINDRGTTYRWVQFLFLVDKLFVILEVIGPISVLPTVKPFTVEPFAAEFKKPERTSILENRNVDVEDVRSYNKMVTEAETERLADEGTKKPAEQADDDLFPTCLPWN